MALNCYVCDGDGIASGVTCRPGGTATVDTAQTAVTNDAYTLVDADIKKDFDQKGSGTAPLVKYTAYSRVPNLQGSFGYFEFKPSVTQNFWGAGQSVLEYTWAAAAFGTATVCKVFTSAGAASASISKCVVSGAKVTLTWAKDATSVDFNVRVLNM